MVDKNYGSLLTSISVCGLWIINVLNACYVNGNLMALLARSMSRSIARNSKAASSISYVSTLSLDSKARVAVLYQAKEVPPVNGIQKPMKPGGYRDSAADISYVLKKDGVEVILPDDDVNPDPKRDLCWCFPDTEEGILTALRRGATHIWANTILHSTHPLQSSESLANDSSWLRIVGQPPLLVDQFDDKDFVNDLLRKTGSFKLPSSWTVDERSFLGLTDIITFPIVAKPIRGRGSHGVKLCHSKEQLSEHLSGLLPESSPAMLEQYLPGEEGTVTVMPPSAKNQRYTALPIVVRFNHSDGIAPYNGVVAVTSNSRALSLDEINENPVYKQIMDDCERVAQKLKVTAPIRIDVRQVSEDRDSIFAIFDVNMKPNMTGPGRPGRENQASLSAMSASALGWNYRRLLREILDSAQTLETLRAQRVERVS